MKTLFLEPFSGAGGNMLLGLLLDLGADKALILNEIAKLKIGKYEIIHKSVDKCGIQSTYFDVHCEQFDGLYNKLKRATGATVHFRNLQSIMQLISSSDLSSAIQNRVREVFTALAEAEAKVHGKTVAEVHFHEVGAVDTIIDIVGCIIALDNLGIERVLSATVTVGSGFVKCAHGTMPVPAPATAELLKNIPHQKGQIAKELLTPTAAALLSVLVDEFTELPRNFTTEKIGYGAGTLDLEIPNVLRGYLGTMTVEAEPMPTTAAKLLTLETNIDDMSPQLYAHILQTVLDLGALDAWITPIIMKKNRPAQLLSVLLNAELLEVVTGVILRETTAIGVRYYPVERTVAQREFKTVTLACGSQIKIKYAIYNGNIINVMPEYEDCLKVAKATGIPFKEIHRQAISLA